MSNTNLRIHPAIGLARVGTSKDYYLGPETAAGSKPGPDGLTGGLPIKKNTDSTTITSQDLRDGEGCLKRQAARFKIFQYSNAQGTYPSGDGEEVIIGSSVDGKTVTDIAWTVHLANKKANCWEIDEDANEGIALYENGQHPPIRNPQFPPSADPSEPNRLQKLIIDAGPRALKASSGEVVHFNKTTKASYWNSSSKKIAKIDYPKSFPASGGTGDEYGDGSESIDTLGEITTESNGRLLVLGGFGKACGFDNEGNPDPNAKLDADVDNDNWLDDTSDGPVSATLIFEDGSTQTLESTSWAVITDPAYAPQTLNAVSLWDDIYNTWIENFGLEPSIYDNGTYQDNYQPPFDDDVFPMLSAAHLQKWNTNLPDNAINAHQNLYDYGMSADAEKGPSFDILSFIRDPNKPEQLETGSPLMPLSLGDAAKSFLTVSKTQYFFLKQWSNKMCINAPAKPLGPGEQLDKNILVNCLGGRFSPGIDMTFIVRDTNLYNSNWQNANIGPFRINAKALDYSSVTTEPFLGVGYEPLRPNPVEPGDICKFMSIPWHTDYNSCATHTPAPNPGGPLTKENVYSGEVNTTLFWSWPAQRPVAIYAYDDITSNGELPEQRYSVRGKGTEAVQQKGEGFDTPAMNVGRYQHRRQMLTKWSDIGIIIQGPAIDGYKSGLDPNYYLEVQSNFAADESNLVVPWPNTVTDEVQKPVN